MDEQQVTPPPPSVKRREDFISRYANNARFETTVFDLKILFGQSEQESGTEVIEQHTAITVPWPVVKLAIYYLQVQLTVHQITNENRVAIPPNQIPPPFPQTLPPELENDPHTAEVRQAVIKLREQFLASL